MHHPPRWFSFPLQLPGVAVSRNPKKFEIAKQLGATDCLNPKDYDKPIQQARHMPKWQEGTKNSVEFLGFDWENRRGTKNSIEFLGFDWEKNGKEAWFQQVLTFEAFRIHVEQCLFHTFCWTVATLTFPQSFFSQNWMMVKKQDSPILVMKNHDQWSCFPSMDWFKGKSWPETI